MGRIKSVILRNELEDDHIQWIRACERFSDDIEYRVVNLTCDTWLEDIRQDDCDILLAKPGGLTAPFKQLYDERIVILSEILGYKIFPSPAEILIYENKRLLSFWLKANGIPHPATSVFYDADEVVRFVKATGYPFVAKTNIGASGSGVTIIEDERDAMQYVKSTFRGRGAPQRTGPNLERGGWLSRGSRYLLHPSELKRKMSIYRAKAANLQKGFVIFQEYIPHDFEWRAVRVGDSFFAHKKIKQGARSSGSLLKSYENPPLKLLDFIRDITDRFGFYSQAIDVFESDRGYLVNEMQCIFGQSDAYQMTVDGIAGRYIRSEGEWVFEPGDFARNGCYDLRLEFLIANDNLTRGK